MVNLSVTRDSFKKKLLFRLLALLQFHTLWRFLNRDKILIVTYHGFSKQHSLKGIEDYQGKHLDQKIFRQQLQHLRSHFNVIPLDQVVAHYQQGTPLPTNPAVITIDDGYKSTYTLAYPVLKELNLPATVFVTTDFVGKKEPLWVDRVEYALNTTGNTGVVLRVDGVTMDLDLSSIEGRLTSARRVNRTLKSIPQESLRVAVEQLEREAGTNLASLNGRLPEIYEPLTWAEVREMVRSGMVSIGGHGKTHIILGRCAPETSSGELAVSKRVIEQEIGINCDLFCYPNGAEGDFNTGTYQQLVEHGYVCGLTTIPGLNQRDADLMELKRLSPPEDMSEFMVAMSGFKTFLSGVKRRRRSKATLSSPAPTGAGGK